MPAYFPVTLHMPDYVRLLSSDPPYARLCYITFQWPSICPIMLAYIPVTLHMPDYVSILSSDISICPIMVAYFPVTSPYVRLC